MIQKTLFCSVGSVRSIAATARRTMLPDLLTRRLRILHRDMQHADATRVGIFGHGLRLGLHRADVVGVHQHANVLQPGLHLQHVGHLNIDGHVERCEREFVSVPEVVVSRLTEAHGILRAYGYDGHQRHRDRLLINQAVASEPMAMTNAVPTSPRLRRQDLAGDARRHRRSSPPRCRGAAPCRRRCRAFGHGDVIGRRRARIKREHAYGLSRLEPEDAHTDAVRIGVTPTRRTSFPRAPGCT